MSCPFNKERFNEFLNELQWSRAFFVKTTHKLAGISYDSLESYLKRACNTGKATEGCKNSVMQAICALKKSLSDQDAYAHVRFPTEDELFTTTRGVGSKSGLSVHDFFARVRSAPPSMLYLAPFDGTQMYAFFREWTTANRPLTIEKIVIRHAKLDLLHTLVQLHAIAKDIPTDLQTNLDRLKRIFATLKIELAGGQLWPALPPIYGYLHGDLAWFGPTVVDGEGRAIHDPSLVEILERTQDPDRFAWVQALMETGQPSPTTCHVLSFGSRK